MSAVAGVFTPLLLFFSLSFSLIFMLTFRVTVNAPTQNQNHTLWS